MTALIVVIVLFAAVVCATCALAVRTAPKPEGSDDR